MNKCGPLVI